jgi:hypothetical protein
MSARPAIVSVPWETVIGHPGRLSGMALQSFQSNTVWFISGAVAGQVNFTPPAVVASMRYSKSCLGNGNSTW